MTLFPYPISTEILTIDFGAEMQNITLSMTTVSGQIVIETLVIEKSSLATLNIGDLDAGIYLLIINHDQGSFTNKIVVE